jgi:hypothetical protein
MAITRAQIVRQLYRYGGDTMGGPNDRSNPGQGSGAQGPAGGASAGGNYGGNRNPEQSYGGGDRNPGLETNIDRGAAAELNRENRERMIEEYNKTLAKNELERKQKNTQKLEILKDLYEDDEKDVAFDTFDTNQDGKLGILETLNKKRTELAKKTLTNSIAQKLGIMPKSYVPSVVMSDMFRTTPKGITTDSLTDMMSSDFDMGLYGISGKDLTRAQNQLDVAKQDKISQSDFDSVYGIKPPQDTGGDNYIPPVLAQAPSITEQEPEEQLTELQRMLRDRGDIARRFAADGGIMNEDIIGGEFDFESARQMYGLGKLVKKATRAVKKVASSPIGKAALLYAGTAGLGALGAGAARAGTGFGIFAPSNVLANLGASKALFTNKILGDAVGPNATRVGGLFSKFPGGGVGAAITAASVLPFLGIGTGDESEEEAQAILDQSGIDIAAIRNNPEQYLARRFRAEGGPAEGKEPVAKKVMPLLDMNGMEKDYRETGGFVPIGRMEKADDVPARLSKNEFVFTADAVRNAGDGDIDKGAEVMYNMMKHLEDGGDVSEESQGLEGARNMFQTSQRLEEVL